MDYLEEIQQRMKILFDEYEFLIDKLRTMKYVPHPLVDMNETLGKIKFIVDNIEKILQIFELSKTKLDIGRLKNNYEKIKLEPDNDSKYEKLRNLLKELTVINENLGKVRVYIRVKPYDGNENKIKCEVKDDTIKVTCGKMEESDGVAHSFYKIMNYDIGNDRLQGEISEIIQQIKIGKSIALFGYGLSGSGKTYTLLGKGSDTPGILHYIIDEFKEVTLEYAFEQYINEIQVGGYGINRNKLESLNGKIIDLKGNMNTIFKSKNKDEIIIKEDDCKIRYRHEINPILAIINNHRIKQGRIKHTPNNPESSRSTLYLIFKMGEVYVIIIDSAGRELPVEIKNEYFLFDSGTPPEIHQFLNVNMTNPKDRPQVETFFNGLSNKLESLIKIKKKDKEINDKIKYFKEISKQNIGNLSMIQTILKEGYYINETLNHLVFFLNKRIDDSYEIKDKDLQNCMESCDGVKDYDPLKCFIKPKIKGDDILTMTIMNWISKLCNPKFIMMCMIRQEDSKCNDIMSTLAFANQIKST